MKAWTAAAAAALLLAGCDSGAPDRARPERNSAAEPEETASANAAASAAPAMPTCPFRETTGWGGAIEGGRLVVNGVVDLQMAGFRPALTERSVAGGTLALDVALAPEPNAAVSDRVRYERPGTSGLRRGEIWCGGERIATFDIYTID